MDHNYSYSNEKSNRDPISPTTTFSHSYERRSGSASEMRVPDLYHTYHYPEPSGSNISSYDLSRDHGVTPSLQLSVSSQPAFPSEHTRSAVAGPSSEHSGDSDFWPAGMSSGSHPEEPKPKKARREKPRIELAPDQPPTTQGKPRARVYVACLQCRTRKIRCDGAKPICHNCSRRANGGNDCNYDPLPKRRGPDKMPGGRQRLAREMQIAMENAPPRRRRRTRATSTTEASHPYQSPIQQRSISDSSEHLNSDPPSSVPLDTSPIIDNSLLMSGGTTSLSNYSGSISPPCDCHVSPHCPSLRVGETLTDSRKARSIVTNYHGDYDYGLPNIIPPYSEITRSYIAEVDQNGDERQHDPPEISCGPSLNFSRKVWWDSLLCLYLSPNSTRLHALVPSQRESAAQSITSDLRFIFRASNYWFSFFHIPSFFSNYFDPTRRERIQPSLVLALLAMSTFWQSSEIGYGREGRERALRFRDEAQAAMDASFNAGWIDETLAQAAWILALFEVCAHPRHSSERSTSSMVMLDSIIRSLSLTLVDADNPNATMFSPGTVPAVSTPKPRAIWLPSSPISLSSTDENAYGDSAMEDGCSCNKFTLAEHWPSAPDHAPLWASTPAWDQTWSEADIRKESCRRLCWSSMILAAGHISYTTAQRSQGLDLFISDPANYALLFSGESVAHSPVLSRHSSKDTIWALHDRSFLLWHGCIRMRNHNTATDADKAQFAVKAWLEADSLEQALNRHICSLEKAFIFQAREYIFNTRMCISYEFQRYVPLVTANVNGLFHRNKAEEWLTHQSIVAERFMYGLHTITGNANNLLARRPFFVFWFMGQIHRALALYECDSTLSVALDVCKALIPAIDYLTVLWPCGEQRTRYESLRNKVANCCYIAGIEPPALIDLSASSPGGHPLLI